MAEWDGDDDADLWLAPFVDRFADDLLARPLFDIGYVGFGVCLGSLGSVVATCRIVIIVRMFF